MSNVKLQNKKIIKEFTESIYGATVDSIDDILKKYYDEDALWYGPQPFNDMKGISSVSEQFYKPFLKSFPDVQKDIYMLFAGEYENGDWVMATGNLVATFEEDWLDIPHTGRVVWIRFGEYYKLENGKIVESRIIVDILDLMRQVGIKIVPTIGPEIIIPGPAKGDGIIMGETNEEDDQKSLKLVEDMLYKGLTSLNKKPKTWTPDKETIDHMATYWHKDMMWYGPGGIGSSRGIKGFESTHELPWEMTFPGLNGGNHYARFAEGNYICSSGWPSIYATHKGGYMFGLPATNKDVTVRVMDMWKREGDLLVENWVFIDMIDLFLQLGIDVFDRMKNNRYLIK